MYTNKREDGRRRERIMSIFLIVFLLVVGVLGEPKIYQNLWYFTRIGDFTWNFLERD